MHSTRRNDAPDRPLMRPFSLSREFWSEFHRERWEKTVTVLTRPFTDPITTAEACWPHLVTVADRYRRDDSSVELKFCIGETQQLADVGRYLPVASDGSTSEYAARVTDMIGGRRFGLVVEDFQAFHAPLWLRLRDFLAGLYEWSALPRESAKATVFFGTYERTPWGVHRGRSANFQFVVDGPKRIRTWPDSYFRTHAGLTHHLDYADHNAHSTVLDGQPGDVLFWPSDAWHVGESVGGALSLAISVALFIDQHTAPTLAGLAERLVQRRLGPSDRSDPLDVRPSVLGASPASVDRLVTRATSALAGAAADPDLAQRLRVAWLNHVTGFGFTNTPGPLPPASLGDEAIVQGDAAYPVLWLRTGDDLVCSASGHAFSVTATERVVALLERLNTGEPVRVGDLVADHAGVTTEGGVQVESTREGIRALLGKLVSLRTLVTRSPRDDIALTGTAGGSIALAG